MIERKRDFDARWRPTVSIVLPYYENPSMLSLQFENFSRFEPKTRESLELIVIDDASPNFPASAVPRPSSLPLTRIFRLDKDIPWNQDCARNVGAFEASGQWLILTDIDHLVPSETAEIILDVPMSQKLAYTFDREKYGGMGPAAPHINSYLMTRELFWQVGGYDEDFAGFYGTDVLFRKRLMRQVQVTHRPELILLRVGTSTILDASTSQRRRKNRPLQSVIFLLLRFLKSMGLFTRIKILTMGYERVV